MVVAVVVMDASFDGPKQLQGQPGDKVSHLPIAIPHK